MSLRIVRLGSPRLHGEGLRIGTVRFLPRGVRKDQYAKRDFFDVWLPNLAPSPATVKVAQAATTEKQWRGYVKRYRREMAAPEKKRLIDLLAALSRHADFSVGCYCEDERRCHRSILRALLQEHGAHLA